ncbi:MAG TPA: M48 family metallopeptidase [Candidatus Baltobacteraceae bacterium]|jgi:predicted Zn-dependent protease|nr:M48 family metallopeptidase [Candidatus Baltobacteraceae bacterium]
MNRLLAALTALLLTIASAAPACAQSDEQQQEQQIGQQVYQQLAQKGEIIHSSPYYTTLNSIAGRIAPVADRQYFAPFHFILVHESQPNAFSVPGGNVYVTDSMMKFVKNKEELAGVLCHEVSHDIHHDVYNLYVKDQRLSLIATGLSLLLGGGRNQVANGLISLAANVQSMHFSRDVEHNADHTGAYICAQSGITPWGMVWLMEQFEANPSSGGNPPEFLSDHPSDSHRVGALESEFSSDPATFSNFNSNIACSTPILASGWNNQYKGGCGRRQASPHPGTALPGS